MTTFLDLARVNNAAKQFVERRTLTDVLTPRLRDDLDEFAAEQLEDRTGEIAALANEGRSTAKDLRAALDGNPERFHERLAALREQIAVLRAYADECDGRVGDALRSARSSSRRAPAEGPSANVASEAVVRLLRFLTQAGAAQQLTVDEEVPFDAKKPIREAAVAMTERMAALLLAAAIEAIVDEEEKKLVIAQKVQRMVMGTVNRLREETAAQVAALNAQHPRAVVMTDIELDSARAMKTLGAIEPIDWTGFSLEQAGSGDMPSAAAVEREVQKHLADMAQPILSLSADRLLPKLMGRSVEGTCDALARAASPLAPLLNPRELARAGQKFGGLTIGAAQARSDLLRAALHNALERSGNVVVKDLPMDDASGDILASILQFRGILPREAIRVVVFDLMDHGDPETFGAGATRDWVGTLPILVTVAELQSEIAARKRAGRPADTLERWLPPAASPAPGSAPAPVPSPAPDDEPTVEGHPMDAK